MSTKREFEKALQDALDKAEEMLSYAARKRVLMTAASEVAKAGLERRVKALEKIVSSKRGK